MKIKKGSRKITNIFHFPVFNRIWIVFLVLLLSCRDQTRPVLTIAAAASMEPVVQALMNKYKNSREVDYNLVTGSSGKLATQILEGAPYDLFIAADTYFPEQVHEAGLATNEPEVYGVGRLAIWTTRTDISPVYESLPLREIRQIAIPNDRLAPYGRAALELIINSGLEVQLKDKLVYGESVSQTNQFIRTGAVDIGLTAVSTLRNVPKDQWKEVHTKNYTPISHSMVCIKGSENNIEAQALYNFILSEDGRKILNEFSLK